MSQGTQAADPDFVADVREGLTAEEKAIPPRWLYDERGSQLFEAITELPEYYLTRTERAILREHAGDMVAGCGSPLEVVEFGAGSADKTRLLLQAAIQRDGETTYCPIDISPAAIEMARERLLEAFPEHLTVRPVVGEYEHGLTKLRGGGASPRLILLIGSTIGNYPWPEQRALLDSVAQAMAPEDRFLLGTDMDKDPALLNAAYNDSQGVTARFTLNLLRRMNRELGADVDLEAFEHHARFNPEENRVEIHLESQVDQTVELELLDLEVTFQAGERLRTEYSYKYTEPMIDDLVAHAGLQRQTAWYDPRRWFGVHLLRHPNP